MYSWESIKEYSDWFCDGNSFLNHTQMKHFKRVLRRNCLNSFCSCCNRKRAHEAPHKNVINTLCITYALKYERLSLVAQLQDVDNKQDDCRLFSRANYFGTKL